MKVLRRQISAKDGDGFVQMKTEEAEDMWHAYNLIFAGDRVRTSTVRKVQTSSTAQTAQITTGREFDRYEYDIVHRQHRDHRYTVVFRL